MSAKKTLCEMHPQIRFLPCFAHQVNLLAGSIITLPDLLEDLIQRWEWRMNIYFDVDILVLSHCLHPGLQFSGLCLSNISKKYVHDVLVTFAEKYCKYLLIENGEGERERYLKNLRMDFIEWIQKSEVTHKYKNGIDAWNNGLFLEPKSIFYRVAIHLLSLPAHAADLERIFSGAKLILTSRRTNLGKEKVLKSL